MAHTQSYSVRGTCACSQSYRHQRFDRSTLTAVHSYYRYHSYYVPLPILINRTYILHPAYVY